MTSRRTLVRLVGIQSVKSGRSTKGLKLCWFYQEKKNESIVINNDIKIVVVEIRGDKVRLGVEAPREVPVHRREVYEAIQKSLESGDAAVET